MTGTNAIKPSFHFISHTHWDREWYLPFEQFRYRLVQLIDHLLDLLENDPQFAYFHLDGQTIVLEDYLQIRPHNRERLYHFIRQGRILVGPWYEQNDLFLTSAESTVRNLMEGIATSRKLGGEMKVGYLPDHFGLIGQMPQILQGVGIDNSVFGRGFDFAKHGSTHVVWRSPDGSAVTGILMAYWYNNAQRLPDGDDDLRRLFRTIKERESSVSPIPHYLLMNGVDHLEAQENLSAILHKLRIAFGEEHDFIHDTLPNYVRMIQEAMAQNEREGATTYPVISGELREREDYAILGGTLSSRVYIKQANAEAHDLLEKWLEPLSVWCAVKGLDPYDADYMRYMWKLYMQNHPHDSICGCSRDAVHEHMMDRYATLREIGEELIDRKLTFLLKQVTDDGFEKGDLKLLAVNTSQLPSRGVIRSIVYFLTEDCVERFSIESPDGQAVPYRIVSDRPSSIWALSPINLPGVVKVRRIEIEWQPEIAPLGFTTYRVRPHRPGLLVQAKAAGQVGATAPVLENDWLKVEMEPDGTFNVTHKATGQTQFGLGRLEDSGDRGDLYVYNPVGEPVLWREPVEWLEHTSNALYDQCAYRLTWHLPASLDETLSGRDTVTVACSLQVTLRLDRGSEQLDIRVDADNRARDHRLRLLFPLPEQGGVWAGGQFDAVERNWDTGREWERHCNAQPYWKWVAPLIGGSDEAGDEASGLALFSKGLMEYEMADAGRTLALTLLRCVETINVRETVPIEWDIHPKGQCIGAHTFELDVRPFAGASRTLLYREAERFHHGLRTKQLAVNDDRWTQGRAWVQDSGISKSFTRPDPNADKPRLPRQDQLFEIDGQAMVSAIKQADNGDGIILRLYNVEPSDSAVAVRGPNVPGRIVQTNLLEEPLSEERQTTDAAELEITLKSKKIETYRFSFN